jgi:hypothetical protein
MPYKVLLIRGPIRTDVVDGIAPEYAAMSKRVFGEQGGQAWLDQVTPIFPGMAHIFITPAWVGILDFESRFPSAIERVMAGGYQRSAVQLTRRKIIDESAKMA